MAIDQARFEAMKNTIVRELYVHTADENYIVARWATANQLHVDFFWLAVHALEKYMKAVLLMNGRHAKSQHHNIVGLLKEIEGFAGELLPIKLEKPAELKIVYWIDLAPVQFVEHLYKNGNADNRYLIFGYVTHPQDVHMLDALVFSLRRLVCELDATIATIGSTPGRTLPTYRAILKSQPDYSAKLFLPVDKIIDGTERPDLRPVLLNLNFAFAPKNYPHQPEPSYSASHNAVLVRHVLDPLDSSDPTVAEMGIAVGQWLLNHLKLPGSKNNPGVAQGIEQAMATARQRHSLS